MNVTVGVTVLAVRVLDDSSALRQKLRGKAAPTKEFFQLETTDGQRMLSVAPVVCDATHTHRIVKHPVEVSFRCTFSSKLD